MSESREVIDGLRALADFLEHHADMNVGAQCLTVLHYVGTKERIAEIARMASWTKRYNDWLNLEKDFGGGVSLHVYTDRSNVCRRVVTGKRIVAAIPAQEAHEVDVVEWVCDEPLLAGSAQ